MLQHRAACFVMNKSWYRQQHIYSVTKMLTELQWPSLQDRRKRARLILMFKIVNGLLTVPDCSLPLPLTCTRANHSIKFVHLQSSMHEYLPIFFLTQNNGTMEQFTNCKHCFDLITF